MAFSASSRALRATSLLLSSSNVLSATRVSSLLFAVLTMRVLRRIKNPINTTNATEEMDTNVLVFQKGGRTVRLIAASSLVKFAFAALILKLNSPGGRLGKVSSFSWPIDVHSSMSPSTLY